MGTQRARNWRIFIDQCVVPYSLLFNIETDPFWLELYPQIRTSRRGRSIQFFLETSMSAILRMQWPMRCNTHSRRYARTTAALWECTSPTLRDDFPPSSRSLPAASPVDWCTQHLHKPHPPPLDKVTHVSLIANGNVSLDVAQMLLTNIDALSKNDVLHNVLDVLATSAVKHVLIIERRGPLEAAFTMKEAREVINLQEASMVPLPRPFITPPTSSELVR